MDRRLAWLRSMRERFWVLPALAILAGIAAGLAVPVLDVHVDLPDTVSVSGTDDTARSILTAIVTVAVSVAGVSFSVLVVALVLASQQLSPRVLRSFQRQPLNQGVLALLLGTASYALFVLSAVGDSQDQDPVPELAVTLAMVLTAASFALFVLFLHHALRSLNASTVIRRIAAEGHVSIGAPYPVGAGHEPDDAAEAQAAVARWTGLGCCAEVRAPRAGYVAAVDGAAIIGWARSAGAVVEQRRAVGAFAVTGSVLAVVRSEQQVDPDPVMQAFVLREERVVDGDIAFPVRQLADIALKGLSPSVNDPTTAENAMDSLTDTLVRFAARPSIAAIRSDEDGTPRLHAIAPTLDALVLLGFDQVRRDAAARPSFAVRLLELLADLREAAAPAHACREIDRQAELVAAEAARRAGTQADQRLVVESYERLHDGRAVTAMTGERGAGGGLGQSDLDHHEEAT